MKQGSNQAIRFYVVDTLKDMYSGGDSSVPVPKLITGVFGGIAGAASVFGNTPIDVVKTRMQVNMALMFSFFYFTWKIFAQPIKKMKKKYFSGFGGSQIQEHNGLCCSNLEE